MLKHVYQKVILPPKSQNAQHVGESWGMANNGEWRTPHFQQKWKGGHNENSLWQLLFIHSLVVCSDFGYLPKFCSENFQKTGIWLCLLFCTRT